MSVLAKILFGSAVLLTSLGTAATERQVNALQELPVTLQTLLETQGRDNVVDLMSALKKSLEASKGGTRRKTTARKGGKSSGSRKKAS